MVLESHTSLLEDLSREFPIMQLRQRVITSITRSNNDYNSYWNWKDKTRQITNIFCIVLLLPNVFN